MAPLNLNENRTLAGRKSVWHSKFAGIQRHVSGPPQYEVLKMAKERCELCGISKSVKALQVDHIVPRSKGGLTVLMVGAASSMLVALNGLTGGFN